MPNLYPTKPTSKPDMIKLRMSEHQNILNEAAARKEAEDKEDRQRTKIAESVFRNREEQTSRFRKYTAFTEQAKDALLEHTIYTLANKALEKVDEAQGSHIMEDANNRTALHATIFQFIHENGGSSSILAHMRMNGNTCYLTETYKLIESTFKKITESVDKDHPDSFVIANDINDGFKKAVDSEDTNAMSEVISDRVVAAITQFIEDNAKDKDCIVKALTATKEKIDALNPDQEDIKESYSRLGKKFVTEVRNRKHGLFNEIVSMVARDVVKNKDLHEAYMEGGSINIPKIVDKVTIMYGFLETVNTMRLVNVTPDYIRENVLKYD